MTDSESSGPADPKSAPDADARPPRKPPAPRAPRAPRKTSAKTAPKSAAVASGTLADEPDVAPRRAARKPVAKTPATTVATIAATPLATPAPHRPIATTDATDAEGPAVGDAEGQPDGQLESTGPPRRGLRFLVEATRPRASRAQLIAALLCGLLGFALVTQVHSTAGAGFTTARQSDLVDILDSLSARSEQLRSQITAEQNSLAKLTGGTDVTQAALDEAQQRAATLQILAGTVAASGPGIELRVADPQHQVNAEVLLGALEELRDAGAEAIQITGGAPAVSASATPTASPGASGRAVRLVASSFFVDTPDASAVGVDGVLLAPPYDIFAIGDPHTMTTAMGIPGGVLDSLTGKGATGTVVEHDLVRVTALHELKTPQYARPAASPSDGG
jgi:uncharacterized protein YlxW (UPF0749 family)